MNTWNITIRKLQLGTALGYTDELMLVDAPTAADAVTIANVLLSHRSVVPELPGEIVDISLASTEIQDAQHKFLDLSLQIRRFADGDQSKFQKLHCENFERWDALGRQLDSKYAQNKLREIEKLREQILK